MSVPVINLFLMIGILMYAPKVNSQEIGLDSIADYWANEGKILSKNKLYQESDSLLSLAKNVYKKNNDWYKWFSCISRMNTNGIKQRKYNECLDTLVSLEGLVPPDSIYLMAKFKYKQAFVYQYIGNVFESIRHFKMNKALFQLCN